MSEGKTPMECFELLKPALSDLTAVIKFAPCNRGGLAVLVATWAFAIAGAEMKLDSFNNAREVADLIVAAMRPQAPPLKVVS